MPNIYDQVDRDYAKRYWEDIQITHTTIEHPLQSVFNDIVMQVTDGKGNERHGGGKDFMRQPWVRYCEVAGVGFAVGQMLKKAEEAQGFDDHAKWEHEMLGALAYGAMAVLYGRQQK